MEYLRVDLRQMHPSALAAAIAVGVAAAARAEPASSLFPQDFFIFFSPLDFYFSKTLSSKSDRRIVS